MKFPEKLKKEINLQIEELENYSFDKSLFVDPVLLNKICFISGETGYEVAVVIDRKGNVVDVENPVI